MRAWTGVSGFTLLWCAACSSPPPPPDPDRKATFPVSGRLLLDGEPLAGVTVVFHRRSAAGVKQTYSYGKTDATGGFKLSTYEAGDGAPAGRYTVTVVGETDAAVRGAEALCPSQYVRAGIRGYGAGQRGAAATPALTSSWKRRYAPRSADLI
jgi:hypothetical protein